MDRVNLKAFSIKAKKVKSIYKRFLSKIQRNPPRGLDRMAGEADSTVWKEVDSLSCANCCKTMSPTYTRADIKRISHFLGMNERDFIKKWLKKDRQGDWLNKSLPCQFLNEKNNHCGIYEVRPKDCQGFPHHTKRGMKDYIHVYKQNVDSCPATMRWVERMMELANGQM